MNKRLLVLMTIFIGLTIVCAAPSFIETANMYRAAQIENKIINSSVSVVGLMGRGSGTVVSKSSYGMYILTCFHVIEESYESLLSENPVKVEYEKLDRYYATKGTVSYDADIIKIDKENDMALLKVGVDDSTLVCIKLAKYEPKRGDTVYSVGNPLGLMRTISKGILSSFIEGFYISDNTSTFGNSGGGLFNKNGELIGIPAQVPVYGIPPFIVVPESGLGMSIELKKIKKFLKGYVWSE